jgi:Periplasmic component of the Tol biopolymer transport system
LWLSERTGWQHIYHYDATGKLIRQVTNGNWEADPLEGVDEDKGIIYFAATEHNHIAPQAYSIKLDGTDMKRLTTTEGTHRINFSPTYNYFFDTWSDINTPHRFVCLMRTEKLCVW